jgi:hypothetical protein
MNFEGGELMEDLLRKISSWMGFTGDNGRFSFYRQETHRVSLGYRLSNSHSSLKMSGPAVPPSAELPSISSGFFSCFSSVFSQRFVPICPILLCHFILLSSNNSEVFSASINTFLPNLGHT